MGLMCLFPPCFILIHFVSLISVPFPTYNEFMTSTEPIHFKPSYFCLLTLSLFPSTKNTTRCLSLLYLIHLSCVAGWDEVTVPFSDSVLREERVGACADLRFHDQNTKINCSVSVRQEFLLFIDQHWNDESTNILEFFFLSANPIKTSMIYKLNL